jgi:hypothetical protein
MAPTIQDFEPYRDTIIQVYRQHQNPRAAVLNLERSYNIHITQATLYRRLSAWGIDPKNRHRVPDSTELRLRIRELFWDLNLNDSEILILLKDEGYILTRRSLQEYRRKIGCVRKLSSEKYERLEQEHREYVLKHLDNGIIDRYGRSHLYTFFRSQGVFISRYPRDSYYGAHCPRAD